jgi:hypothetical protein
MRRNNENCLCKRGSLDTSFSSYAHLKRKARKVTDTSEGAEIHWRLFND